MGGEYIDGFNHAVRAAANRIRDNADNVLGTGCAGYWTNREVAVFLSSMAHELEVDAYYAIEDNDDKPEL